MGLHKTGCDDERFFFHPSERHSLTHVVSYASEEKWLVDDDMFTLLSLTGYVHNFRILLVSFSPLGTGL